MSATGTTADGETWFQYAPSDPDGNESVRLVAQPAVERDAVETYGWDLDGDGTADRRGRALELPGTTGGETAITLVVERADGSTASVTRDVPVVVDPAGEAAAPDRGTTPVAGGGDGFPVLGLVGLLLLLLALAVLVVAAREEEE